MQDNYMTAYSISSIKTHLCDAISYVDDVDYVIAEFYDVSCHDFAAVDVATVASIRHVTGLHYYALRYTPRYK